MTELKEWLPPANWAASQTRQFVYFAAGLAERRLGSRGRIAVQTRADAGGGVVKAIWNDDSDRLVLTTITRYPKEEALSQSLDFGAGNRAQGDVDMRRKELVFSRMSEGKQSSVRVEIDSVQPFDWRVTWGFRFVFIPWSAGMSGPLLLGGMDWSLSEPFNDGYTRVSLQTGESEEIVDTLNGQIGIKCWRIEASGPRGSEFASIGKASEGLVRFDMNMTNSALLIGIAG